MARSIIPASYMGSAHYESYYFKQPQTANNAYQAHHEHFDGSGYPYGLHGDDISVAARILSVAESYDSVVSARPHRGALSPEEALQMARGSAGTRFDPEIAELFATTTLSH